MAEPYGVLLSSFFSGTTGMRLQALGTPGKDALLLAVFLTANEWANMIGLYELSPAKVTRRLPCVKGRALERALELLASEQFAFYDTETEFVWVREMARIRLGMLNGEEVANPRRRTAAQNLYQRSPLNPFLGPFYDRYHVELALKHRRGSPIGSANGSPNQSPNGSPTRSPNGSPNECQVPVRTASVQQGSVSTALVPVQAAAAPRLSPVETVQNPQENIEVITSVITKEILPIFGIKGLPILQPGGLQFGVHGGGAIDAARLSDLQEATKERCARMQIAYNSEVVERALKSALVRASLHLVKATAKRA